MTPTTTTPISRPRSRVAARAVVAVGAVIAALLVWTITVPVLGISVTVPETPGSSARSELAFPPVLLTAGVATLAGWALLALLERFTTRARTAWTVIAVAVLLFTMPYVSGFTVTERIVLASLHLAVAGVLIPGLRRTARPGDDT